MPSLGGELKVEVRPSVVESAIEKTLRGVIGDDGTILNIPMPDACRKEMIADWRGAGKAQGSPKTWEWWEANKHKLQLHPDTRAWVEVEVALLKHNYGVMKYTPGYWDWWYS